MKSLKRKPKSKAKKPKKAKVKLLKRLKNKLNSLLKFKAKPKDKTKPQKWKIPRTAQDTIPIQKIYAGGIWQKDNKYSKSWAFTDINFHVADEDDKNNILLTYANILKSFFNSLKL